MKHYRFLIPAVAAILIGGSSCSSDNVVDDNDCLEVGFRDKVNVSLSVKDSLSFYKEVNYDYDCTRCVDGAVLRYTIGVYELDAITRCESVSPSCLLYSDSPDFTISLKPGKYRVLAWADYEPMSKSDNHYFHIDDFSDMMLVDKFGYHGSDVLKMGFLGCKDITVSYRTPDYEIQLESVMGQYRLTTSDTPEFEVGKVVISYPSGVPASLNAITDNICYIWDGISYVAKSEDYLTFDNILAENEEYELELKIEVYDKNEKLRARRKSVKIPIIRGGITDAKIQLYTVLEEDEPRDTEGGCGINDKYDDTIFIRI